MIKKLKLFLLIIVIALTGGCTQSDKEKEEREIAMRVIETYAHIIRAKDMEHMIEDERLMYYTAIRIIKDYLDKGGENRLTSLSARKNLIFFILNMIFQVLRLHALPAVKNP